jgi:tetratricopeptide (TPR) repeat protein
MLDSSLSETRTAVAMTLADDRKFDAAEQEFKRAIQLNSSDALAHLGYSQLLVALGRGEDAQREVQRAVELDPLISRPVLAMQRYAHWLITGQRPYVQLPPRERRPNLKLEPGEPWALARQAEDLAQVGECAAARSDLERAQRLAPDNVKMRPFMGRVDWWCGDRPRARMLLDDTKRRPDARDLSLDVALLHTFFGEKDSAFVWLEHHPGWTLPELTMLSASPYLDPLRSDPRYLRLQRRLGVRK